MEKTLDNTNVAEARTKISDLKVVGDGDLWLLLSKASSAEQGWMKSTKAMEVDGIGCIVQVTTHQRNHDGTNSVAEALAFVPAVEIVNDTNGGRKLIAF